VRTSSAGIAFSDSKDITVPALLLACFGYLGAALPASTLGLLWPSARISLHEPVGALGIMLIFGVTASVISSAATGRILSRVRVGPLVAVGTMLLALALALEALAPSLWVFTGGMALFGLGFGAIDSALSAHAASHFGARDINWMHASYGLGATIGPLLVTALLSDGLTWRLVYGIMAVAQVALACVFTLARRSLATGPPSLLAPPRGADEQLPGRAGGAGHLRPPSAVVLSALVFVAVETGIESGAGIWGYIFLTAGRGLPHEVAGVAVSAYWATMFAGRVVIGPVAERVGPARVLASAVAGVTLGAALMTAPGPAAVAVIGMMTVGLAAAPIFPLLTLTTAQRGGAADATGTTRTVGLQVAASAIGSAALPAVLGLAIGAFSARVLAPFLLVLGLAMCGVYRLLSRLARSSPKADWSTRSTRW
jgi:fucose permease